MRELIIIFIGGGMGSCLRYALSSWLNPLSSLLPWGTFLANIFACVILGIASFLFQNKFIESEAIRLFVIVGICGGFSTFSTFSSELFAYWKSQQYYPFALYALLSLVLCYLAIFVGMLIGKWLSG